MTITRSFQCAAAAALLIGCSERSPYAQTAEGSRLPGQEHNRMVCIQVRGKPPVFVDMPGHWDCGCPEISPDGKMVAFSGLTVGDSPGIENWLVGVDGTGLRKLGIGTSPRWSPDGKQLLITQNVGETPCVFITDVATGKERKICEGRFPDWSPDGNKIVFARGGTRLRESSGDHFDSMLYLTGTDGREEAEFAAGNWPSWSPSGRTIACTTVESDRSLVISIIDVKTRKRTILGVGYYRAQWSGDGKAIVCNGHLVNSKGRLERQPVRFWLDQGRIEFFALDLDVPFSPCVSRDGRVMALIVDSKNRK